MSHTATCDQEDPNHTHEGEDVERKSAHTAADETKADLKT